MFKGTAKEDAWDGFVHQSYLAWTKKRAATKVADELDPETAAAIKKIDDATTARSRKRAMENAAKKADEMATRKVAMFSKPDN